MSGLAVHSALVQAGAATLTIPGQSHSSFIYCRRKLQTEIEIVKDNKVCLAKALFGYIEKLSCVGVNEES